MWLLLGQRVHWVCDEGEINVDRFKVCAVTGTPRADEDLSVTLGRALLALDRAVDSETVLLLEAGANTVEPILEGLRLSCWRLRRLITGGNSVFLEGRRKSRRRLKTADADVGQLLAPSAEPGIRSLELATRHLLGKVDDESMLVDPFAFDLRSLQGAEMAGLHSISFASPTMISRHVAGALGFSLKVEVPCWPWLPPFLLDLSKNGIFKNAARHAHISPARVYQAMKRVKEIRLAVNAVRTGRKV